MQSETNDKTATKRGRKPNGPVAMTPAQRKRRQVERQETAIMEIPSSAWTESICLQVLRSAKWPAGSPLKREAWAQLGRLQGFIE